MSKFDFDIRIDDVFQEEENEVIEDNFEAEPPKEPKAKLGDIYQLGKWVICKKCGKKHYID